MISRINYEIWFVDYFDGKLSKEQKEELFNFLKHNADLKAEFDQFPDINLSSDESVTFHGKDKLKKDQITEYNYKTFLIALSENDLGSEKKKEIENFIAKNSYAKRELEILKLARIVPDHRIILKDKKSLKKEAKIIAFTPSVKRILSIAAALLIFTVSYFLIKKTNDPEKMIAGSETEEVIKAPEQPDTIDPKNNSLTDTSSSDEVKKESAPVNDQPDNIRENKSPEKKAIPGKNILKAPSQNIAQSVINPAIEPIKKDSVINNIKNHLPVPAPQTSTANMANPIRNLSDIFSEDDIADLSAKPKKDEAKSNGLFDIAQKGLSKLTENLDVSFNKEESNAGKEVKYAFVIGKISVSHTGKK